MLTALLGTICSLETFSIIGCLHCCRASVSVNSGRTACGEVARWRQGVESRGRSQEGGVKRVESRGWSQEGGIKGVEQ